MYNIFQRRDRSCLLIDGGSLKIMVKTPWVFVLEQKIRFIRINLKTKDTQLCDLGQIVVGD